MSSFLKNNASQCAVLAALLLLLTAVNLLTADGLLEARQEFDRRNLYQFFDPGSFDNDLVLDSYLLPAVAQGSKLSNLHLLNLHRDRLAYIARKDGQAVSVAVPAIAEDGFNGKIDLLIAVDMFGRISAARVIEDINSDQLYGVVDVIDSKWMNEFAGNSMRDILRLSWQPITAENEYDQFVGASITPKSVANQVYDALVFYQSNRIELMRGSRGSRGG
ncbi:MAG: FMN-binding protein [Pseudomonadales bacterium]|jgi:electron transport complex protein RnfG|tara:strand:- start:222 stop:878 length:657 start_codon:yes stop_codon:yes gene_type:complete